MRQAHGQMLLEMPSGAWASTAEAFHALTYDLQVLGAKGLASSAELHGVMEDMDMRGRKALGARIVARAWVDPAFKARLLADAAAAAAELGIASSNFPPAPGEHGFVPGLLGHSLGFLAAAAELGIASSKFPTGAR